MTGCWIPEEIELLDRCDEMEITTRRPDGSLRAWVPIWVVCVGCRVFVRTWHRRDDGWFGRAASSRHARIRVPGLGRDVDVEDLGAGLSDHLRAAVDAAYRSTYGRHGSATVDRMTTDAAAAATLELLPSQG